jgi:hypothetical protein
LVVILIIRELRALVFFGPEKNEKSGPGPIPGIFPPVSSTLFVHEHIGTTAVTTYNWLLGEKEEPKCYTLTSAPLYLDFKLNASQVWLKLKMSSSSRRKSLGSCPH